MGRLLHLADVVQERLVSDDFTDDPAEHFLRLRASELDLRTCWEILQKFDQNALTWLKTTRAYDLVVNRIAIPKSPKPVLEQEEEGKCPDTPREDETEREVSEL